MNQTSSHDGNTDIFIERAGRPGTLQIRTPDTMCTRKATTIIRGEAKCPTCQPFAGPDHLSGWRGVVIYYLKTFNLRRNKKKCHPSPPTHTNKGPKVIIMKISKTPMLSKNEDKRKSLLNKKCISAFNAKKKKKITNQPRDNSEKAQMGGLVWTPQNGNSKACLQSPRKLLADHQCQSPGRNKDKVFLHSC